MASAMAFAAAPAACLQARSAQPRASAAAASQPASHRPIFRSARRATLQRRVVASPLAAVVAAAGTEAHLQLATAKLPVEVSREAFVEQIYQWAATLTTNGRNLPFALPLKCDRLPNGFSISLLRLAAGGEILSVADIVATVEPVAGAGDVLIVRFYEGEAAAALGMGGSGTEGKERLQTLLSGLVDVPLIMQTMPADIKRAVMVSR